MRATHTIEQVLGSRSRIAVLRVLWRAKNPLNASQIAQRSHLTRPAVADVLADLAGMGIVRSSSAGRANIHSLNRSSIYVERWVAPLFDAETELAGGLLTDLEEAFRPAALSAVLFGSYARGDQGPGSDIDVTLVTSDASAKAAVDAYLITYSEEFRDRWGAPLSSLTYTVEEAGALWRTSPALWESLKEDGIVIFGKGPWEWVEDE